MRPIQKVISAGFATAALAAASMPALTEAPFAGEAMEGARARQVADTLLPHDAIDLMLMAQAAHRGAGEFRR